MNRFVAIDVEVSSRSPTWICAIGVARFEAGCETAAYQSLVRVEGRVHFTRVHGITSRDLANAPAWPVVWQAVRTVIGDIRTFVAFRASFDRSALLTMSARYGIRLPRVRFVCAAAMIEARHGVKLDLRAALEALDVPFPGRPHDPLADARAAARIALACAAPAPAPLTIAQR